MYMSREDIVTEFHKAFGHPVNKRMTEDDLLLRHKLLTEEWTELKEEFAAALTDIAMTGDVKKKTKERMLKEMADLQYVLSGMAVTFGLPLQVAFVRVHKSNMSKLDDDGRPIYREDGKVLKSKNYKPADMEDLIEEVKVPGYDYYNIGV